MKVNKHDRHRRRQNCEEAPPSKRIVVSALGVTQILAWGSTFYLLGVLAPFIARDTGWSYDQVIAGVSVGLVAAGLVSPRVGRLSDRDGTADGPCSRSGLCYRCWVDGLGLSPNFGCFHRRMDRDRCGYGSRALRCGVFDAGQIYGAHRARRSPMSLCSADLQAPSVGR